MKIKDILTHLETSFPLEKQESWDHSGLQVGNIENECDYHNRFVNYFNNYTTKRKLFQ